MKRVTMRDRCALPTGALHPGKTYRLDDDLADDLVAKGHATLAGGDETPSAQRRAANSRRGQTKTVSGSKTTGDGGEGGK